MFLTACIALLLAVPALCSPVYDFALVRTDDGSVPGTWTYTLYNNCSEPNEGISLDAFGVFGSTGSGLAGVDPAPGGWSVMTDDPEDWYPDEWQVTWVSNQDNVPDLGQSVGGFTVQGPASASQPTDFVVYFYDGLEPLDFGGKIQSVPEPSTAASLAAALPCFGIPLFRRRRSA